MPIGPKRYFGKKRVFVDRENHLRTFKEAVDNIRQKEFSILVYYGVAGIGKTSLRKEFAKYLEEYNLKNQPKDVTWASIQRQEVIWTSLDLQLDAHREKSTFLVTLKNELQMRHKIDFPAFEIAHAIYWKKAKPEIPLRKENYLLFEGDIAFDDFFGVVNQIPYSSIVPASLRLLINLPDYLRKWWAKKGEAELKQLSEKEPLEIEQMLPYFFAQDLNNYLEDLSKIAVLFIDTYEVLRENYTDSGYSLDKWIREELIQRLPKNVLWIIFGREALKWEEISSEWREYLIQYEIEELLRKYCIEYLESRGIIDTEIKEAVLKGSKGVPHYLELSADTYVKIVENGGKPKPGDFGNNHQEIADRFFRFLSREEKSSLNVLSIPRYWDYDLFNCLVKKFNTGYPTNNYEDLCSFSFIIKTENNKQQMHQLMQECLQRTQEKKKPDSVNRIHKAIVEYYTKKLENINIKEISQEHETALTEAFYHAKESLDAENLLNWFIEASEPFNKAAYWQLIAPKYEEILQILEEKLGLEHPSVATTLNNLAVLYKGMGDFEKALLFYQKDLEISEKILGSQHVSVATTLNNLAEFYYQIGDYEKALPLYQRALEIVKKELGPQHSDVATIMDNMAELYCQIGDYEKSLLFFQKALEIYEEVLGLQHPDAATTLNNLAGLYKSMGDYEKALSLYQRALEIRENVLDIQHPDVAATLNNLATLYYQVGDYEKALPHYQRALEIVEVKLGFQHPYVAITQYNIALIYEIMGKYEKALPLLESSLEIFESKFGPDHPYIKDIENKIFKILMN